jgi:hypothetical protein
MSYGGRWDQTKAAERHGTNGIGQGSDGTGTVNHFAKYDTTGLVTDSTIAESDVLTVSGAGGGSAATLTGQNSWYGQVPRGTINGSNTVFFLDYKLANPYAVLHLNGVGQLPDVQGDPAHPLTTMAVGNSEFSITGTTLTVVNAPRPGERFYIYYFRKDAVVITGASITIWTAWRNSGAANPQAIYYGPLVSPHYNGFGSFDGGTTILSAGGLYSLRSDTTVISTTTGTPADYLGAKVLFALVGTVSGDAVPSVAFDIYDVYLTLTLADGTFQTLRPRGYTFASGSNLSIVAWQPLTNYPAGTVVVDANGNEQLAQNTGTSGAVIPSWSTSGNTTDGSITWAYQGVQTSQTGQIQDPTLAYDAEGVLPPVTRAIFSRIHYSGFADPGSVVYIF